MPPAQTHPLKTLTLAIETSNPSAWTPDSPAKPGVALGRLGDAGAEVLGIEPIDLSRSNEDDLMPAISRLFARLAKAPGELARVAVSVGPGGFTAVRLAVTTAKMITEATGAQCLPIPTAQVAARRVRPDGRRFGVALASKGDSAFVTIFAPSGQAQGEGMLVTAADLAGLDIRLLAADQFLPQDMRAHAAQLRIEVVPPILDPIACLEAARDASPIDPAQLFPLYPREPEAVTKWKKLHPPA